MRPLGHPRHHLRRTDSTNNRARELALAGAPHGTLVTASEQTAGRGRQGRRWSAPPGSALLMSLVLRQPPPLLTLAAGLAVCDVAGPRARLKWPNDVVFEQPHGGLAKLAGILAEGRPQEGWAVLGIGLNVAVDLDRLPAELRHSAASLELSPQAIEPLLARLLDTLSQRLAQPTPAMLEALRLRDALRDRQVAWEGGRHSGRACGIDDDGQLLVVGARGEPTALAAGEVHLQAPGRLRTPH